MLLLKDLFSYAGTVIKIIWDVCDKELISHITDDKNIVQARRLA
jgi:hypothetical protein